MANPHKGEVSLKAGDQTYTLCLTINAICDVEEETGHSLLVDLTKLSALRLMLYAAMKQYQPKVTKAEAGAVMMAAGVPQTTDAVTRALQLALAKPKDGEASPENP